jgi:hypothetical protein
MPRLRTAALEACHAALSGDHGWSIHCLIAPEATGWLDGDDVLKVQIDHRLQGISRGRVTCCFGQRVEPTCIFRLKRDQPRHRLVPAPR